MRMIHNNWSDLGFIVGLSLALGFLHWSNFIVCGVAIFISIISYLDENKKKIKK